MTEEATYTDRKIEQYILKHKDGGALHPYDGWTAGAPQDVLDLLEQGDAYGVEVQGFNRISGFIVNGTWYHRKSDQEIEAENQAMLDKNRREHNELVDRNREDWTTREAALPDWAKNLMNDARRIVADQGEDFEYAYMGWGYQLIATELAVLFVEMGDVVKDSERMGRFDEMPEDVQKFESENGLSGNQAGWAWAVARAYLRGDLIQGE